MIGYSEESRVQTIAEDGSGILRVQLLKPEADVTEEVTIRFKIINSTNEGKWS